MRNRWDRSGAEKGLATRAICCREGGTGMALGLG